MVVALIGDTLATAVPSAALLVGAPSPGFPSSVRVGQTFAVSVAFANNTTAPESLTSPSLNLSDVDLVPACATVIVDCVGGVDAGVFGAATGTGTGVGIGTCAGPWSVVESTPGTFRLTPPGGNGSLLLSIGDLCQVTFPMLTRRMPTTDSGVPPGVQTGVVVSTTFSALLAGTFRNLGGQFTTVHPAIVTAPGDYDGDGDTDPAVYRPSNSVWYSTGSSTVWGATGDIPVPGDYDGDGRTDRAVFRPPTGVWYLAFTSGGAAAMAWGAPGDVPVPADYDGDARSRQGRVPAVVGHLVRGRKPGRGHVEGVGDGRRHPRPR